MHPFTALPASVPDPFFPLAFLVNSWALGTLDDLFQSLFLCALLLFWLCVYHGIRVQVSLRRPCPDELVLGGLSLASRSREACTPCRNASCVTQCGRLGLVVCWNY